MNDKQPTLFLGNGLLDLSTLVFLVDPVTHTFWHRVIPNDNYHGQFEELDQQIEGLRTVKFRFLPDVEQTLFLVLSLFCKDLSKEYELDGYASYIKSSRLKNRDSHVTVFEDETGTTTRFDIETDCLTRELKIKGGDNKAEKMTLAEFLGLYNNKENEK